MDKYEILKNTYIEECGVKLYRIRALRDFGYVKKGDIGGFVSHKNNLSQTGNCWLYDDSRMYEDSSMYDNSIMYDNSSMHGRSRMHGNSRMYEDSSMYDNSIMHGNSSMRGRSRMHGNSRMYGNAMMIGKAILDDLDRLSGIVVNKINCCEFNITASIRDEFIRVGCQSHSFDFWREYIKTNSKEFESQCTSPLHHQQCLFEVQAILLNADLQKRIKKNNG